MRASGVYEGTPTTTTALLASVLKIGVFSILVQIDPVVLVCAVLSIAYMAMGALNQTKIWLIVELAMHI